MHTKNCTIWGLYWMKKGFRLKQVLIEERSSTSIMLAVAHPSFFPFDSNFLNGRKSYITPVLKHGPRSLTFLQVSRVFLG